MIKVSELTGAQLDYWVARAEGVPAERLSIKHGWDICMVTTSHAQVELGYSRDWCRGGPLIEKYRLDLQPFTATDGWNCETPQSDNFGDTPLQAICRAVVRAAFGDEVEEVGNV